MLQIFLRWIVSDLNLLITGPRMSGGKSYQPLHDLVVQMHLRMRELIQSSIQSLTEIATGLDQQSHSLALLSL